MSEQYPVKPDVASSAQSEPVREAPSTDVHVLGNDVQSAVARLRSDLQKVKPFPDGTILAFTSVSSQGQHYHYSAIFAAGQWWFTGQGNGYFPKSAGHQELVELLATRGHTIFDLKVATQFESIEL
jgi:hypothetical protein